MVREKSEQEKNLSKRKILAREKSLQEKTESGKDFRGIKDIRTTVMKDILAIDNIFERGMMGLKSEPCPLQKYKKSKSMCSKSIFVKFPKDEFKDEKYNFLKERS